MLIIELSPTFTDFKTILGEHSWAKFLRKPSAQEKTMSSQVFHCTYSTTRDVEKYGERRVHVCAAAWGSRVVRAQGGSA